jgi:hypothetical protein
VPGSLRPHLPDEFEGPELGEHFLADEDDPFRPPKTDSEGVYVPCESCTRGKLHAGRPAVCGGADDSLAVCFVRVCVCDAADWVMKVVAIVVVIAVFVSRRK